jgi:PAS domain S-box-containing protein
MSSTGKSREQLVSELSALRERVKELESRAKDPAQHDYRFDEVIRSIQGGYEAAYEAILLAEEGVCLGLNHAARQMFGCTADDAVGKPVENWVIEGDREIITRNLFSGPEQSYEVTVLCKDGSTLPAEIRARPMQIGERILYTIALRDRQIEQELLKSQSLLTSVIEQSPTPIAIARPDGSLEVANDAAKELLGIANEPEIPGVFQFKQPWEEYDAGGNLIADDQMALALALNGVAVKGKEVRVVRDDGGERWVLVDSIPVYDAKGNLIAGVAIFPDITELKQIEQELIRTQSLLTSVIEQAPIPIVIARPDGIVEMVNQASRELLGVLDEPGTGAGTNLYAFVKTWMDYDADGSPIPIEDLPLAHAIQGQTTKQREMRVVRKDGSERRELVDGGPVYDNEGNLIAGMIMFPDITEFKEIEQQLKTSHRHLTALMENSTDYILISDETGTPLIFNNAYRQIMRDTLGLDMKPGIKPHTLLDDESAVAYWEGLHERVLGGESFRVEFSYPLVNGEIRHFEFNFTPIIEDGEVKGFSEISRDITERRHREELLQESETRFRAIFENSVDAIAVSREGVHIALNEAFLKMFGYNDMDELIGQPIYILVAPSQREHVSMLVRRRVASAEFPLSYETVGIRRDSSEFDVDVQVSTYDLGGKVYTVTFLRDITERKKADRALRESRTRLETLLQASPTGIILLSNRHFQEVNDTFCTMLGYSRDELIGQSARLLYPSQAEFERVGQDKYNLIREQGIGTIETQWVHKDGTVLDILLSSAPLDPDNWESGVISTLIDITERKRAEQELERYRERLENLVAARTAELEAANVQLLALSRVKDEFISNVSHELRSPITSLKVNLHALTMLPEKRDTYVESLRRELTRLENLVENLLTVSSLDQERVEFSFEPVDLNELLQVYADDRQAVAEEQGLTLAIEKSPDLPPVDADINQMGQVVSILLTNALNYTPAGGTVTISTRTGRRDDRDYVCFCVCDTGPGIPPGEQAQLFERFFRGKAGRDSGAPGTGLGLSIAKEIVDRHGGLILAANRDQEPGAVFTVWLPIEGGEVG